MLLTPLVNSLTCLRRYRRKASLFQRPNSMIVDVLTSARYRSIAQLERSEWVPTLFMSMPNFSGPSCLTWDTMCDRICLAVICTSLFVDGSRNVLTGDDSVVSV